VEVGVGLGLGFGLEASRNGIGSAIGDTLILVRGAVLEPDEVLVGTIQGRTIAGEVGDGIDAINDSPATSGRVGEARGTSIDDSVWIDASVQELRRNEGQLTEVTLEVVNRRLDGVRGGVTGVTDARLRGRASSTRLRVNEVGELTLQGGADDGFVVLELASLLIDRGHDVLNSVFRQLVHSFVGANDGRGWGAEVFADGTDVTGGGMASADAVLLLGVGGGTEEFGLNPSGQTASAVWDGTIVDGGKDVRGKREFHRTLEVDGGLGQLAGEFILNASDVEDVLRQVGHVDGTAEHVDVVFHFFTIAEGVLLEGRVLRRIAWVNVSTIENAEFNRRVWVAVNLPAERGISRLGTAFCHGRDWGVLGIDVGDEVREFFSDTDAATTLGGASAWVRALERTLILELGFEQ